MPQRSQGGNGAGSAVQGRYRFPEQKSSRISRKTIMDRKQIQFFQPCRCRRSLYGVQQKSSKAGSSVILFNINIGKPRIYFGTHKQILHRKLAHPDQPVIEEKPVCLGQECLLQAVQHAGIYCIVTVSRQTGFITQQYFCCSLSVHQVFHRTQYRKQSSISTFFQPLR